MGEVLWAPQAERWWVHSNQEEQDSGDLWGCPWRGACPVDPGVPQDCWSQGRGSPSGGAHRTGWCEFKDLQAACSPDRCWGSNSMEQSGKLSTVLCMILLYRAVTISLQLQRGGKSTMDRWWEIYDQIIWGLRAVTDVIPLCYLIVHCFVFFPATLNKVGEINVGGR